MRRGPRARALMAHVASAGVFTIAYPGICWACCAPLSCSLSPTSIGRQPVTTLEARGWKSGRFRFTGGDPRRGLRRPLAQHEVEQIKEALQTLEGGVLPRPAHRPRAAPGVRAAFRRPTSAHPYDANPPGAIRRSARFPRSPPSAGAASAGTPTSPAWSIRRRARSLRAGAQVPEYGGDTVFTNLAAAYQNLSPAVKALADGLWARHQFGGYNGDLDNQTLYAQRCRPARWCPSIRWCGCCRRRASACCREPRLHAQDQGRARRKAATC